MKGDKGTLPRSDHYYGNHLTCTSLTEFAGTLLGFDDYVSKYCECDTIIDVSMLTQALRYGSGGCDRVVRL